MVLSLTVIALDSFGQKSDWGLGKAAMLERETEREIERERS